MKKNYFLMLCSLLLGLTMQAQVSYSGNGDSGFGGTVGGSTLNISDDGTTMTFSFSRGGSNLDNIVVIYVDSKSGGFTNTNSFNDTGGADRVAISTTNGSRDPEVSFPSGFTADYAITAKNDFAGIFELQATGSHTFIDTADLTPNNDSSSATHTFTVDFSQIGITNTDKFDFVVTYCSVDSWLSNEVIGDTSNITAGTGASPNPGPDGSITFSDSKSYPNTWTGTATENNYWENPDNWTEGVPTTTHNVYIPLVTNPPATTAAVSINKGIIKSGASLVVNDAFTGTMTYERELGTANWYLMSSPVSGVTFNDSFVSANGIDSGTDNNKGIATYTTATDSWSYLQAAGSISASNGLGYSVKRSTSGTVTFTGTVNNGDISIPVSNTNNGFNLIGNPYLTHFNAASFIQQNTGNLVSETLWLWNQSTGNYETYNILSGIVVAPTQGFFVRSSNGINLTALSGGQLPSIPSYPTFQKTSNTKVKLMMNDGTSDRFAKIYYLDNVTKGFDNGFDGETFSGIENSVDVFTNLVADNQGKKYQIQALPIAEMETMVVPIGIKADAGKEITFTSENINLPSGLKVFLEDRTTNTFTLLDEANSNYKVTLTENTNGIGRFYLHTKSSTLSTNDVSLENVSVYTVNKSILKITGLSQGKSNIKVFNVLGKQVLNTSFQSNGVHEVSLPNLSTGLYIVQLENESGKLSKKIVLE